LEEVSRHCDTQLGADATLELQPSFDINVVSKGVKCTAEALELYNGGEIPVYSNARDVRTAVEAAEKMSSLAGEDLFRIGETLGAMARLRAALVKAKDRARELWGLGENLAYLPRLQEEIEEAIHPDGEVDDSASPALKSLRAKKLTQSRRILDRLQNLISGSLRNYLQEPIYTQREGRYVVPVKSQYRGKVPGIAHDASASGQTVFIEPAPIVDAMNALREIEAAEREEVERILLELSRKVGDSGGEILVGIEALAELDCIFAKARYSALNRCSEPAIKSGRFLSISRGHHPLIDRSASVPLDVSVGGSHKSLIITGPNTGGKTVCLKVVGLYSLMIGCGIFPPASNVIYGPFADVWADIGDEQSLQQSLSTFSGHLKNISRIFKHAQEGSLCLFDEIGAGTDPREGAALGKAILSRLSELGAVIVASTHYGEIKEFALQNDRFVSAAMEFDAESLKPTYRIIPGATGASHALEIARRYGIPKQVVDDAENQAGENAKEDREKSRYLDDLIREAHKERDRATALRREVEGQTESLENERRSLRQKREKDRDRLEEMFEMAIRESRQKYDALLEMIKRSTLSEVEKEAVRVEGRAAMAAVERARERATPHQPSGARPTIGASVTIKGRPQLGKVVEISKSDKIVVQFGSLKMTVPREDVSIVKSASEKMEKRKTGAKASLDRSQTASSELVIRHMRAEDAKEEIERFFDDASLAGIRKARIVHGKGEGILRKIVRQALASRKDVARFYDAEQHEGGTGVTVVEFTE
jgi:DNA mismatch repair protein MutS2